MQAQSYYLAPGKTRDETDRSVDILDTEAGTRVVLTPDEKQAVVVNYINRRKKPHKPRLMDIFEQMEDLLAQTRDAKQGEFKQLGEKEIDGRHAIGFSYDSPMQSLTLWGDPATGLPVLVEIVWNGSPKNVVTMSHFELNETLDPALFDTTPPADYKVQTFDVDMSKPTEAALIDALRLTADLNDGVFADQLEGGLVIKQAMSDEQALGLGRKQASGNETDKSKETAPDVTARSITVARGVGFALELRDSADAHYAGKGVKHGEPDRPIFWYKPESAKTYRVIYADLTVKDAETAPEVVGAVRLEKTKPVQKQEN